MLGLITVREIQIKTAVIYCFMYIKVAKLKVWQKVLARIQSNQDPASRSVNEWNHVAQQFGIIS